MAKNVYWVRSLEGTYGQVTGAAERDRWAPLGWKESDEPADTDFVWMRADGIEQPARYPYAAREYWASRGWTVAAPPEPVDDTKDPALADQPAAVVKASPAPATSNETEGVTRG